MPDINFGLLNTAGTPSQANTVQASPDKGVGMLNQALGNLFGTNAVRNASSALAGATSNADPKALAASIMGGASQPMPQPQANNNPQVAMMGDGGNVSPTYGQPPRPAQPGQPVPSPQGVISPESQLMMNGQKSSLAIPDVYAAAKDVYKDNPTMAKLATAQAIQESRLNGTPSTLASKHNNLFGIKGKGSAGSVTMMTHEYVNGHMIAVPQQFAAYKSPRDSMIAHKALMSNKRYKSVSSSDSVESGAQALQDSGYATDPNYAKGLIASSKLISDDNTQLASNE